MILPDHAELKHVHAWWCCSTRAIIVPYSRTSEHINFFMQHKNVIQWNGGGGGLHIYIYFPCIVMGHVPVMGHVSGTRNVLYMTRVQHENGCPHSCNMLIFCGKTILFSVIGDLDQRSLVIWPCWGVYFPFCRTSPLEQWPTYLPLGTACPVWAQHAASFWNSPCNAPSFEPAIPTPVPFKSTELYYCAMFYFVHV